MKSKISLNLKDFNLNLTNKTVIMGILNLSPDSPIKNSIVSQELAVERAYKLKREGATIIDIGAHSTSSKARDISTEREIDLVVPLIRQLIDEGFLISLDSWNPSVVEESSKVGLNLLNDVSALQNPKMISIVKQYDLTTCIMHMRGEPKRHYEVNQHYDDITKEIRNWISHRIKELERGGISREKLIIDPGFEFGKSMKDNLILLNELDTFSDFSMPILVSASNKGFIAEAIGLGVRTQKGDGLREATLAVQTLSSYLGVHILRVHDVKSINYVVNFINTLHKHNTEY